MIGRVFGAAILLIQAGATPALGNPVCDPATVTLMALLFLAGSGPAGAEVAPAKPYAQVAAEVIGFLFSDVGRNGIRTNDNDPGGYAVPPYFYSYAINDGNNLFTPGASGIPAANLAGSAMADWTDDGHVNCNNPACAKSRSCPKKPQ